MSLMPTPPANIELVKWGPPFTNVARFTVYSTKIVDGPRGVLLEERVVFRPAEKGDNDRIRRAGYRWARMRRRAQAEPTSSPPSSTVNPVPQLPATTNLGSIFGQLQGEGHIYGPDPAPGFLGNLVNQVVAQLPNQIQQPVQNVLENVLGQMPRLPTAPPPPPAPTSNPDGEPTQPDHTVRNVLILLGGVGVVAFFFARFARR